VPIYRGNQLVGAIGISGDGIDQDDMIAFLGTHNAAARVGGVNNAPPAIRSDQIVQPTTNIRLRWVGCPFAPFLGSNDQNSARENDARRLLTPLAPCAGSEAPPAARRVGRPFILNAAELELALAPQPPRRKAEPAEPPA
jgi:hypothetical protein